MPSREISIFVFAPSCCENPGRFKGENYNGRCKRGAVAEGDRLRSGRYKGQIKNTGLKTRHCNGLQRLDVKLEAVDAQDLYGAAGGHVVVADSAPEFPVDADQAFSVGG